MFPAKKKITPKFLDTGEALINGESAFPQHNLSNGRSIYITDNYVLKVDDRGYSHDDVSTLKRIKKQDRKYFVPVIAEGETDKGDRWIIQPYVELKFDYATDDDKTTVYDLCEKYHLFDVDNDHNWALHNGQPIIFDYGL